MKQKFWGARLGLASLVAIAVACSPRSPASHHLPKRLWGNPTCAVPAAERDRKQDLLQASLTDTAAAADYAAAIASHARALADCRDRTWPSTQAVWLRLYPHDVRAGVLEDVLDRIVNRGYNQVYIEIFYEGRILLPVADNPTPWRSILAEAEAEGEVDANYDLWAEAIQKGRDRGLEVYGWMFALNFGWSYANLPDRQAALARNGWGETSIANARWNPDDVSDGRDFYLDPSELEHLFIDPYNETARADYLIAVEALLDRDPDGMLFDYIRYPTTFGRDTLVTRPQQLWIYSPASRQVLRERLSGDRERALMDVYLERGELSTEDIRRSAAQFPDSPLPFEADLDLERLDAVALDRYRQHFWTIATTHAYAGVLDFAEFATAPVRDRDIPAATVFFPSGNRAEAGGFDARMQPWDRFASELERHPMSYAICEDGSCVADQVRTVLQQSPTAPVCPILAGTWGQPFGEHLSLEAQMQLLQTSLPELSCISHFVYAWMEPASDRDRKAGVGTGDDPL
ncbi:hypothetical protein [Synechococcus sp. PCC 7336]|uniref:hypothetical protein n=1 Tax=Synechococcus sp. PCC 7336 TaxID=195250 RepID=UPI0003491585|nr:hypothetical protein [Synechococcus sp. PCC 7336]